MKNSLRFIVEKNRLIHNFNEIKNLVGETKICAVVKANAYGTGVKPAVKNLMGKADFFAVSSCCEAREVRRIDSNTQILILMPIEVENAGFCSENNISITVQNSVELKVLSNLNIPLKIHVKINTGLNRLGEKSTKDFLKIQNIFKHNKQLKFEGIFTHFSNSDSEDERYFEMQYSCFKNYLNLIYPEFKPIRHCCNTAAAIKGGEKLLDMVRIGKALYGYNPIENFKKLELLPVASITTRIVNILDIGAGEYVGYNTNFKANKKMKIATIQIGFNDGYRRAFSNNGRVIINSKYCNILGNISMDSAMVDITHVDNVNLETRVVILGEDGDKSITAKELADRANTTIYEILCSLHTKRMRYIVK